MRRKKIRPVGRWHREGDFYTFQSLSGTVHARVVKDHQTMKGMDPWVAYTYHTEGNDRFDSAVKARRCCERRLSQVLTDTEPLRNS